MKTKSVITILTMKKAIIFVASPAEQGVKGMHALLSGDGLRIGTIYVWRTLRW